MLKYNVKYEDFDGNPAEEILYFNLSKTELIDLEITYKEGLEKTLQRIIETKDNQALITEFKRILLMSYGVKSEDGKRFIKSDELREQFSQTAAYDALFVKLATDADAASAFVNGIMPRDMVPNQDKPVLPPPPPHLAVTQQPKESE
jgi:predicted nucleic acid-binding protein